jgi:uncharacterized protein YcbK (DUF882 family)
MAAHHTKLAGDAVEVAARRRFLRLATAACAGLLAQPSLAGVRLHARWATRERSIGLHNLHTDETLHIPYWRNGVYLSKNIQKINWILRDHRTDEVTRIDPNLLDLLYRVQQRLGSGEPFDVLSGYRSPRTNAMLRSRSRRVAKRSLHMEGRAVDICLPNCRLSDVRRAALSMEAGGVGYYPRSNFVHLDTGDVRSW